MKHLLKLALLSIFCYCNIGITTASTLNDSCAVDVAWDYNTNDSTTFLFMGDNSIGDYHYWNFGDGNWSTEMSPNYTFTESGTYNVCLTVIDEYGTNGDSCVETECKEIIVIIGENCPTLEVEWTATNLGQQTLTFTSTQDFDAYSWHLGDGNTSHEISPTYTYTDAGWYYVHLYTELFMSDSTICSYEYGDSVYVASNTINDSCQAHVEWVDAPDGPYHTFDGTGSEGDYYYWDFGDGNYSSDLITYNEYAEDGVYTVCLYVYIENGDSCFVSECKDVYVDVPINCLLYEPVWTAIDLGNGSYTFNQPFLNTNFTWNFGDGAISTEEEPTHTYTSSGNYLVIYKGYEIEGNDTCFYISPQMLVVTVNSCDSINLITSIAYTGYATPDGLFYAYAFDGGAAGGTAPYMYFWDFGDGTTSSLEDVFYGFNADSAGTQTVCLSVQDANACSETMCTDIIVGVDSAGLGGTIYSDGSGFQGGIVQKTGLETLGDVTVQLKDVLGNVIFETITDENGQYYFDNLFYGTYLVHLDIEGINSPDFKVELMPDNPINENFNLTVTEEEVLDVEDVKIIEAITVYPNPTNGSVTLDLTIAANETLTITVLNVLGQVIQQVEQDFVIGQNTMNLDLNNVQTGLYLVNIQSTTGQKTVRIVKQ